MRGNVQPDLPFNYSFEKTNKRKKFVNGGNMLTVSSRGKTHFHNKHWDHDDDSPHYPPSTSSTAAKVKTNINSTEYDQRAEKHFFMRNVAAID